jgi:3-oxoacyl-[acyl-carrier-protein] synthase III
MSRLIGIGHHLPAQVLDNVTLASTIGRDDAWIMQRTGIRERRIAAPGTGTAALAEAAGRRALDDAGLAGSDLDVIIVATSTPDHLTPPTACEVQASLGAYDAAAFDVEAGFAGWIYALIVADALLAGGTARTALVIGAEKLSAVTDRTDPATAPLFGDGAGAVVLAATPRPRSSRAAAAPRSSGRAAAREPGSSGPAGARPHAVWRLGARSWWADGRLATALRRPGGGSLEPFDRVVLEERRHLLRMEGTRLFRQAVRTMAAQARATLESAGLAVDDIDLVVPHQANLRILQAFAQEMHLPIERVVINIERYGNTGSATVPIALDEALREDRANGADRTGYNAAASRILLVSFGAGATAGALLLEREPASGDG